MLIDSRLASRSAAICYLLPCAFALDFQAARSLETRDSVFHDSCYGLSLRTYEDVAKLKLNPGNNFRKPILLLRLTAKSSAKYSGRIEHLSA